MDQVTELLINSMLTLCQGTIARIRRLITVYDHRINRLRRRISRYIDARHNTFLSEAIQVQLNLDIEQYEQKVLELEEKAHRLRGQMQKVYRFRDRRIMELLMAAETQNQ